MLSSLCAQTYYIEKLTSRTLWRRHRLELVSTSRACELRGARGGPLAQQRVSPSSFNSSGYSTSSPGSSAPSSPGRGALLQEREVPSAEDAFGDGDAMAASPAQAAAAAAAAEAAASLASAGAPPTDALAAAALARVQAADAAAVPSHEAEVVPEETALAASQPQIVKQSATDLVASRLAAAAQAAASAAAPLASAAGSAVGSAASAAASNVGSLAAAAGAAAPEPLRAVAGAAAAGAAGVAGSVPLRAVAGSLQSAAAGGYSTAIATIALVTAAVQSSWGSSGENGSDLDGLNPEDLDDGGACAQSPTEWFVADDPGSHTRYFIIQGSDTLDHWKVNLSFDPVTFEDPDLGVKVHRGVYQAALRLYDRFLPLVVEHVSSSPFAKVVFAGHSLGGSLGTLLMLMFLRRGVLPPVALSPAYTFGAPAVLCDAAAWGSGSSAASSSSASARTSSLLTPSPTLVKTPLSADPATRPRGCSVCGAPAGDCLHVAAGPCAAPLGVSGALRPPAPLLERLCLPPGAVRNVVMARDIVPRAFTCDYSLVAGLLWAASGSFRGLECLHTPASAAAAAEAAAEAAAAGRSVLAAAVERASSQAASEKNNSSNSLFSSSGTRQVMYTFIGRLVVLQPDASHAFVKGKKEADGHPLLPSGPGLYTLREPALLPGSGASGANNIAPLVRGGGKRVVVGSGSSSSSGKSMSASSSPSSSPSGAAAGAGAGAATPPPMFAAARLRPVKSVSAAVAALMDQPHPLEMLADKGSYGDDGSISRYHNPDHYTQAVGGVLRARAGSSRWRPLAELAEIGRAEPGRREKKEVESDVSSSSATAAVSAAGSAPPPAPTSPPPLPFLARLSPSMRPQLGRGGGTTVIRARPAEKVGGTEIR